MSVTILPAGTATGNADAVRQGTVSSFFHLMGDLMKGVDSQPVMDSSTKNNGLLGPTATFGGVDIGVGANGEFYIRGTPGAPAGQAPGAAQPQQITFTPAMVVGLAVLAYFAFR